MWERAFKRIPTNISIRFFSGPMQYYGTVTNLSEKGMFISTKVSFPLEPQLRILMPLNKKFIRLPALIRSFGRSNNRFNGIGVELLGPPGDYLEFVNSLRKEE